MIPDRRALEKIQEAFAQEFSHLDLHLPEEDLRNRRKGSLPYGSGRLFYVFGEEDGRVAIRVRDHGPGIPEGELPFVKKKFYKGSSKERGSGIGLAVCDEIVSRHGGELLIENAEGGGVCVTVRLPIARH